MPSTPKAVLRWVIGLLASGIGVGLIVSDAIVTEEGKIALHTINAVVALVLVFVGGFVVDPAWASQLIQSVAVGAGDFMHARDTGDHRDGV